MRGRRTAAARLQSLMPISPAVFEQPGDGGFHLQEGRHEQFFKLSVLPTQPAQIPNIANNVVMQVWGTVPSSRVREFYLYQSDREGRCAT